MVSNRIQPDLRKPRVRRTQYTRKWYWTCKRCDRAEYGHPTHETAFHAARSHAYSKNHYYNRYTTKQGAQL